MASREVDNRITTFQVGGAGEGNLPRPAHTTLKEEETASMLNMFLKNAGEFKTEYNRKILQEAFQEYALPYCPWAVEKAKKRKTGEKVCNRCGCDCKTTSATTSFKFVPEDSSRRASPQILHDPVPSTEVIPRLKYIENVTELTICWRKGFLGFSHLKQVNKKLQKVPPLRKLLKSSSRKEMWSGYSDKWWKMSGNKQAFAKIRRIIKLIISESGGNCKEDEIGVDAGWSEAVKKMEEKMGIHKVSKIYALCAEEDSKANRR